MKQALINDGRVTNIIVGGPDLGVKLGEDEWCDIGAIYDPDANPRFTKAPVVHVWTAYQFLLRFTEQELETIRQGTSADPILWRFLTFATAAQEVFSDDPMTIAGMNYLVFVGLLTEERKNEILG